MVPSTEPVIDMTVDLDRIEAVAIDAVEAAGTYLHEEFHAANTAGEYGPHDVKAEADRGAERRALAPITDAFPDHRIYGEESGELGGDGPYRWIVDPLDGTNEFTAGVPTFASAVTVLSDGKPVVAAIHHPVTDHLYVARRGRGVTFDGEPVTAETAVPFDAGTCFFVIGHRVKRRPERAERAAAIRDAIADEPKRVIDSWCPCVHWPLLARGLLQGVVAFFPDEEEQRAGELLVDESGASSRRVGDAYVAAPTETAVDRLADTVRRAEA